MRLHDLVPAPGSHRNRKRIGRGIAAGQGKTSCKGQKGQKSRTGSSIPRTFEGGQLPLTQRLPKLRGFNNKWRREYEPVNIGKLRNFKKGSIVDLAALIESGILKRRAPRAKLLGAGGLDVALTVRIDRASASAIAAVEAAGGKVEILEVRDDHKRDRTSKKNKKIAAQTAKETASASAAAAAAEPGSVETEA